MSVQTKIVTHRTIPSGLVALLRSVLVAHFDPLKVEDGKHYKIQHYAGEFLAEDNLDRLVSDVSQFPYIMYDIETIDETDVDSTQTMPEDTFSFILFCCVANRFHESSQWSSSYDLAWDARRAFQGVEFENEPEIHANGFFIPLSIERELHVPGMSVHTLRIDASVIHDVNAVVSAEGGGYNFSVSSNSSYIPLI